MLENTPLISSILDVARYQFSRDDRLFIDTNIWILIHAPSYRPDSRILVYTEAWRRALNAGAQVFATPNSLAEFVKAYSIGAWRTRPDKKAFPEYKQFRSNTESFGRVVIEIDDAIQEMKKHVTFEADGIEIEYLIDLLPRYGEGRADFTDLLFAHMCYRNNWTLVTDDADYVGIEVNLLTANRTLLSRSIGTGVQT